MCECEPLAHLDPAAPRSFLLRNRWQNPIYSHRALHSGLSSARCQLFRRLPFLLVVIKTRSRSQFPSCFCTLCFLVSQETPSAQSLVIFYEGKECWEIERPLSGSAKSVALPLQQHQTVPALYQWATPWHRWFPDRSQTTHRRVADASKTAV